MFHLATRLAYRIDQIQRDHPQPGLITARLSIAGALPVYLVLVSQELQAFAEDLGLRPTSQTATEYVSAAVDRQE